MKEGFLSFYTKKGPARSLTWWLSSVFPALGGLRQKITCAMKTPCLETQCHHPSSSSSRTTGGKAAQDTKGQGSRCLGAGRDWRQVSCRSNRPHCQVDKVEDILPHFSLAPLSHRMVLHSSEKAASTCQAMSEVVMLMRLFTASDLQQNTGRWVAIPL